MHYIRASSHCRLDAGLGYKLHELELANLSNGNAGTVGIWACVITYSCEAESHWHSPRHDWVYLYLVTCYFSSHWH